ncbi:SpoIIE family protein phosphatase [Actinomycetospora endophytica]|uniref:SpoIIE family protein phosphatase n=1 Tax=Actinomycetospora endophytica TaxID=2291215 RepID=A0ABS8PAU1_9PSEU|nr:GAF domain-containing SpoIIE family protein phosphatase [Actinomycetospora endophytica]MCD2195360.1 SpoIIE family protein phosphatase [Actinomycetospora endophytica]
MGRAAALDGRTEPESRARLFEGEADDAFERLARLATSLTDTPVGVVWLLRDDHLVLRSKVDPQGSVSRGTGRPDAAVHDSWAAAVRVADRPVWVDDVLADPTDGPATTTRAWAGAPVHDRAGAVVGVLGVIDVRPRAWSAHHRDVLITLAQAATGEVVLRSALAESRADSSEAVRQAAASDREAQEAGRQAREAGVAAQEAGAAARYYRDRARSADAQAASSDQVAGEAQRLARLAERHAAEAEELAATLRESLLPARLPEFPRLEVAARHRPGTGASVLGDFYDLFPTPGGWGAVIGDVCGKGPQAARTTALARSTVRALGHTDDDPEAVLAALNGVLHVWFDKRASFVTTVYLGITPRPDDGLEVRVASAGHPPAVVQRRDGSIETMPAGGRALGVRAEARVAVEPLTLDVGDRVLVFTDGVTEARPVGGREFEMEGLLALLGEVDPAADAHTTADAVLTAVDEHAAGAALDDTALLVIRAVSREG